MLTFRIGRVEVGYTQALVAFGLRLVMVACLR